MQEPSQESGWTMSQELEEFAFRLYAGPCTTKFVLEDTFGHLRHISNNQNKGRQHMAKPTQWLYASTAPCLASAKLPSPDVTLKTFQDAFLNQTKKRIVQEDKEGESFDLLSLLRGKIGKKAKEKDIHHPGEFPLPEQFPSMSQLLAQKREWKAAGYRSNREAAAALMYVLEHASTEWSNATKAWSGQDCQIQMPVSMASYCHRVCFK